jgi:GNAT superfamily N-acetyltransferase
MKIEYIRAGDRHRADINRLIVTTKIGDGFGDDEPIRNFWVARIDGRIIGCAGLEFINDRAGVLTHVAVEKEFRRQGVGSELIRESVRGRSQARAQGHDLGLDVLPLQLLQAPRIPHDSAQGAACRHHWLRAIHGQALHEVRRDDQRKPLTFRLPPPLEVSL